MAAQKLNLTRDQLATFLKNHEQIKQFEALFQVVSEIDPTSDTTGIELQAGNAESAAISALAQLVVLSKDASINANSADNKAQQALDALNRIANALELAALQPALQNNNSVVTDYIDLPEFGPHVTQARRVQWNQDDGTMDVGLYGGSVLQVGQELMFYSKNTSGSLIPNGTPVMFTGTVGSSGKLTFGLAVADGSVPADYMMGVATQDIANNAFGYVTSFGLVRGFNTTGAPYGEVWADGDLLYFGAASPGTWTKVQPIAPRIDVPVAVVINVGAGGSGSIFVRMTVAESLAKLQDVYISGLANGDMLVYDSADQRWENRAQSTLVAGRANNLSGGLAGSLPYQTAVNTTAMLAIGAPNRVLTSNGSEPVWSDSLSLLNLTYTGTLTGGTGVVNFGSGQFYKDAAGKIGIGTILPAAPLQIGDGSTATLGSTAPFAWVSARARSASNVPTTPQELLRLSWQEGSQDISSGEGCAIVFAASLAVDAGVFSPVVSIASFKENASDAAATGRQSSLITATSDDGVAAPTDKVRLTASGYSQQLAAPFMSFQGTPTSKAAAATLTGAELVAGILNTTGTTYTITLPTGTNIEGALLWGGNGVSFDWWVINTASGTITIGANGNTTLGALTVAANVSAHFRIRRTNTNTFTIYRLS